MNRQDRLSVTLSFTETWTGRSAFLLELILAYAAKRAGEILGNVLPLGSGSDAAILIALSLVIDPAADCAYVFHILLISFPEASPLMHGIFASA